MSGFDGINQFGSLTTQSGQKLSFKDFDKDGDGKITQEEYDSVMKDMKLDSVELSTVDKNGDKEISEDEFALWEQKTQMQAAVNDMAGTISKDFAGKTQYLAGVTTALKEFIEEFASSFTGDVSNMAEAFKSALPAKYAEIKSGAFSNDSDTVKSNVLDDIYAELTAPTYNYATRSTESMPADTAKRIAKELEAEADKFIKGYKGQNLKADLKAHLEEYMNKSDAEKLKDAANTFIANSKTFGAMIDNGAELKQLKEYAKEFLLAALDKGVTVKLGGTTIKTEAAITTALNKFTDGDELKAAMEDLINGLGTETLKNSLVKEEEVKAQEAADKAFADIKGDACKVNASIIDYSCIDGYFNNGEIYERGKGWEGSRDKAYNKGEEVLNSDALKNQLKAQIQTMLEEKGIPFDKIETIFENVYTQSVSETLNSDGMITGRGPRGLGRKGKAYINIKNMVDTFINTFNTNIAKEIDGVNASNKDFDLWDIDYTQTVIDENGNIDEEKLSAMQHGDIISNVTKNKKEDAEKIIGKEAENMIDRLQSTILMKAQAMCEANGVEFDLTIFNTMFNNAKSSAVAGAVIVQEFYHNRSITNLDPKNLIETFTTTFKESYTAWVDAEAAEAANK